MGDMFSPKIPAPQPVAEMPDMESPAVKEAARSEQQRIMGRSGRRSTILTAPDQRGTNKYDSYSVTTTGTGS